MDILFVCTECSGSVVESNIKGQLYPIRTNVNFIIPTDFNSAICDKCGSVYLTYEESIEVEKMYQESLRII
jgi:hypothetical protein